VCTGIVVRAVGGFFDVYSVDSRKIVRCMPRGRFKEQDIKILVGDKVHYTDTESGYGVIERIYPRKTKLDRPRLANVDQVICVVAAVQPAPDLMFLDRLLLSAAARGLQAVICVNKVDLDSGGGRTNELQITYGQAGYTTLGTSAVTRDGLDDLMAVLAGRISTLAGQSGVGKSSLINRLYPEADLETGLLSGKASRGRHTTKETRLFPVKGGLVADTPGFTKISVAGMEPSELACFFPELHSRAHGCRFKDCFHRDEPGCAVKSAVGRGEISRGRYERYVSILSELEQDQAGRYR